MTVSTPVNLGCPQLTSIFFNPLQGENYAHEGEELRGRVGRLGRVRLLIRICALRRLRNDHGSDTMRGLLIDLGVCPQEFWKDRRTVESKAFDLPSVSLISPPRRTPAGVRSNSGRTVLSVELHLPNRSNPRAQVGRVFLDN
jgi:hypothetical protein